MNIFRASLIFFIFLTFSKNSYSEKISIVYTINNVPVTNIEIQKEITYLGLINQKLSQMDNKSLVVYASKSVLREKIKESEISKFFKFGMNDELVIQNMQNLMISLGSTNLNDFNNSLKNSGLDLEFVKKKIEIELLWNRLIFEKYKNKLTIDENKIKENLKRKIQNSDDEIEEYKISEILFSPSSKDNENKEIEKIILSIKEIGFENTAMIYSLSATSKKGGDIGWIKENQLSESIVNIVKELEIGEITSVIDSPTGKLILILKDKRKIKKEVSFEKELEKAIILEKNKQLNQFSSIYFKKVELDTNINER